MPNDGRRRPPQPEPDFLTAFAVAGPVFVERTARASVWKVARADGRPAALKVYHGDDMRNEAPGFRLLQALDGAGAAEVYGLSERAALIEWLDGPSLGDLSRRGADREACERLADAACRIHSGEPHVRGLPTLDVWLKDLFRLDFAADCPAAARRDIGRCQQLGRDLLADAPDDATALHGDLHHDNVRLGARGYCAFDAKGVFGDRAYELANAFRNPKGAPALVRNRERVGYLADIAAARLDVPRPRLLKWAAVKCALSIAWRAGAPLSTDPEFDLLSILLAAAEDG